MDISKEWQSLHLRYFIKNQDIQVQFPLLPNYLSAYWGSD